MSKPECSARSMAKGEGTIFDLALSTLASQLLDRLDHQKNPAHAGVIGGQPAAVGIDREFTTRPIRPFWTYAPPSPF